MTDSVVQTRRFARAYKKLHASVAASVDDAVAAVAADPEVGEQKKGDLATPRGYKFRVLSQFFLLGHSVDERIRLIYLEAVGPHENFYRGLER